ncbi:DOPA 4,5-dioxygenase family protein [Ferrovibrio sp.]|uniref:DOPA 4,5-dioxygenase family protein n=1 Tax=Ferrovibrio sp. TaxID=1917215 RepID=UPI0035132D93
MNRLPDTAAPRPVAAIASYHAHVYFDGPAERETAAWLRDRMAERFAVMLGRWHDRPVGPHASPMYQVAFDVADFARLVPWLMLNRRGLSILVHPNTGHQYDDHLSNALWLGPALPINGAVLPRGTGEGAGAIDPVVPNTTPVLEA